MVLRDPTVTVAILETARGGLLKKGLGYRRPNVACCLNVQSDHLGLRGIDTLDQLAEVKRIPIEVALDTVVLNADDPRCLRMAVKASADNVCYVTLNPEHALVREHPSRWARGCTGKRHQWRDDQHLCQRLAYSSFVDALDSGDVGGSGHSQRAECNVCRGYGLRHGRQA